MDSSWFVLKMAPIVDTRDLPNEQFIDPPEFRFPLCLDFTDSVVDEEGVGGLLLLIQQAKKQGHQLRLRLRSGSQVEHTLSRKGFDRIWFQLPILLRGSASPGVTEWSLQESDTEG